MRIAQSRLTSQGQVSVPAQVRRRLGLAAGSILEWETDGEQVIVSRGHRYSSADLHAKLFPEGPPETKSLEEVKEGIRHAVAKRHARS
jgi:antitoxin PrlF